MQKTTNDPTSAQPSDSLNSASPIEQSSAANSSTPPKDASFKDASSNQASPKAASTSHSRDARHSAQANAAHNSDNTDNAASAKIAELVGDLQRTRADFENFRKQVESQKSLAMTAAKYATVEKLLPLIDDFERALTTYPEQLAPLQKNFDKTLSNLGLARIDSNVGTEFNPDLHEAVSVEDDDGETEVIAETLRPGYLYDGAVLRAAMVRVKHQ